MCSILLHTFWKTSILTKGYFPFNIPETGTKNYHSKYLYMRCGTLFTIAIPGCQSNMEHSLIIVVLGVE